MRVDVRDGDLLAADAGLVVVGLHEGEDVPPALAEAPGAAAAKGGFKSLSAALPRPRARECS